jgi:hypothetical protein
MFEIDQEIIDRPRVHCPKWEVCLTGTVQYCCEVIEDDCEHLIVEPVEESGASHCPRCIHVNPLYICICPVRREIFKKYGK